MKNKELIEIWGVLTELECLKVVDMKFAYIIAKNKNLIKPDIEILTKLGSPPEEMKKYEKEREELCKKFCEKDDKNNPIINNYNYLITTQKDTFDSEHIVLREKYQDMFSEIDCINKKLKQLLEEDCEKIKFYKIKLSSIPENIGILQSHINVLEPLIEDDLLSE